MKDKVLFKYVLRMADDALILGQRLGEWCGHGPVLEEDIALSNTALDYIGQATSLYKYACDVEGGVRDEDALAFVREESEYTNLLMLELPNGDYAFTTARQFLYSTFNLIFLQHLQHSKNDFLKGFAEKSIKEVRYHVQHSTDWVLRMGDGTEESHQRIQSALNDLWAYTHEFFMMDEIDSSAVDSGFGVDKSLLYSSWIASVQTALTNATLNMPVEMVVQKGGRVGRHTEYMGFLLSEMQFMQRAYPGAKW